MIWYCSFLPEKPLSVADHSKCAKCLRMNTRRNLLFMLGAGALILPLTALAQQQESRKTHQIGFLTRKKDASVLEQIEAFRQKLHDLGWTEGSNINIVYRDAD